MLVKTTSLKIVSYSSKFYPKYAMGRYRVTKYYFLGMLVFKSMELLEAW